MGYSKGTYRDRTFLPPLPRPKASTSRFIDGRTRRFKLAADGGFVGMSDTMQRVILLLSFEVPDFGEFSTDFERETWRRDAIKALRPLTDNRPPLISDLVVVVESPRIGQDNGEISFLNEVSGDREELQL